MTVNSSTNFDAVEGEMVKPNKLAHVVFRSANFNAMRQFYLTFLGATVSHEDQNICFMTYDEEHHRLALINMPHLETQHKRNNGFEHMAFTYDALDDLLLSYRQRKARGISPVWTINHGPTTSIYYQDPDKNIIETQFDNFDSEKTKAFMRSESFQENPVGVDFDPEELIERIKKGETLESLVTRADIGKRGIDTIPKVMHT